MSDCEDYDLEQVYDEQISPLMVRIIAICMEHRLPMVAEFQFAHDPENGGAHCTTALPFEGRSDEKLERVWQAAKPTRPICLAETTVTNPDGSKEITIARVS